MTERLVRLQALLIAAFSVLVLRLVHLQGVRGAHFLRLAEQNRLRLVPEQAPRGLILDRKGRALASNETVFRVAIVPQELDDLETVMRGLAAIVRRPPETLLEAYRKERTFSFVPATILPRVPKDMALRIEEDRWRLPGLLVKPEAIRDYPMGSAASQLLGHLSQPTADEVPLLKQYGVRPKELIGRMGLEQLLDGALRGRSGGLLVEVNHRARQVRVIGRRLPEAGAKVVLTIDAQLQSLIEQAFGPQPGACVVIDPQTGDVLAIASLPTFSPAAFTGADPVAVRRFLTDPLTPLMNRASVGVYQPGSIIKLITAAAGLEQKIITPQTTIVCPGSLRIGDRVFHCWNRDGHGPMTLNEALMQSCNVYFMTVAQRLGAVRLREAMEEAGLSHKTGWPLEEQPGHLPHRHLSEGEIALLGIGQGELLVTTLQAAVLAGAFANGGWMVEPSVVRSIADRPVARRSTRRRLSWSGDTITAIRRGMEEVVRHPSGTGHRAYTTAVSIAGKTGTAQTSVPGQTNGWFVGFCPVDHPRVAMAIVAERGGSGGDLPAEVARTICEYVSVPDVL